MIKTKYTFQWVLKFPIMVVLFFVGRALSPLACLFVTHIEFTDRVKRFGKVKTTMERERLVWWLSWFDTHDNTTDEYWYGMYEDWFLTLIKANQSMYDRSWWLRYYCRVMWLQRNNLYTFNERFFSKEWVDDYGVFESGVEDTIGWSKLTLRDNSFQYEAHKHLFGDYYNSINIGWKKHKNQPRMIYAGGILRLKRIDK
jgi:hypothetical protein